MHFFILSLIVQVLFVMHVLKTGRNTVWIYVVMLLPVAGVLAYLIIEILPDFFSGMTGKKLQRKISTTLNPDKDLSQAATDYSITDTVQNSSNLAQECLNKGMYDEAKELYEKCLTGIHAYDPALMHGLAQSEYGLGNYAKTKQVLDKLISENPDFKNQDAHLLYAKALDKMGEFEQAKEEYGALHEFYPGPEASFRFAIMLKAHGDAQQADEILEKILSSAETANKDYHSRYKEWIVKAKQELGG